MPDSGAENEKSNVEAMLDAVLAISSDLDLHSVLHRIVESSCAISGARFGYLAVLGGNGDFVDHVVHGLTDDEVKLIGDPPIGRGLIGRGIRTREPVRPGEPREDPDSSGFPPDPPAMQTFLGLPVRVGETVFGTLYLTEKIDGEEFTARDEARVSALARVAGAAVRNARAYSLSERRREWVEATAQVAEALHPPLRRDEPMTQIAVGARRVARAALAAVVHCRDEGYDVPAADGTRYDALPVLLDTFGPDIARAQDSGELLVSAYEDEGTVVITPLDAELAYHGVLLVLLDHGRGSLPTEDRELLASFAAQSSLALDRAQAMVERQEQLLVADRDRIARDLHDLVIQRLFATGLQLQGARRLTDPREIHTRLDTAVADLDATIRDIRATIFELEQHNKTSFRGDIGDLVREYAPALGFTPLMRMTGPLEGLVTRRLGEQVLAVLREALSNCVRHASAESVVVEIDVDPDWVRLRVTDDGRGITDGEPKSGLRNLRRRAEELGGRMAVATAEPRGTRFEWRVPNDA